MNKSPEIPNSIKNYTNESVINIYCERYGSTKDIAQNLFNETLEFLWSCKLNKAKSPTMAVDEMWHVFILHTKDYQNFCSEYLGKFIHHHPLAGFKDKNCDNGGPQIILANCDDGGPVEVSANCVDGDEPPPCSSCSGSEIEV